MLSGHQPLKISNDKVRDELQKLLVHYGYEYIEVLPSRLAGGVISHIYEARDLRSGTPLVLKFTEDRTNKKPPFNERVDHFISRDGHNLDAEILIILKADEEPDKFIVPSVKHFLPQIYVTLMPDLRGEPYNMTLFSNDLRSGITKSGYQMGFAIAHAQFRISNYTDFIEPNETTIDQFGERGEGLLQNNRDQKDYRRFLDYHLQEDNPLILTDLHPKNIFLGLGKEIGLIDFGRTTYGDPDFVLPNFCSHILLNLIIGNLPTEDGINYVRQAVAGFRAGMAKLISVKGYDSFDEDKFIFFTAAEVLNRHKGKFVDYFNGMEVFQRIGCQNALNTFANALLSGEFKSIESMLILAQEVAEDVSKGSYTHAYKSVESF